MKVCYLNRPGLQIGGAQTLSFNEAKELAKDRNFDVHMMMEGSSWDKITRDRITIWIMPKAKMLADLLNTYKILKKINADVYLERVLNRSQRIFDPLICKLLGKKYIYAEVSDPEFVRRFSWRNQLSYKALLTFADEIVANAQNIAGKLPKWTSRRINTIPVHTAITKKVDGNRKYLLWVGRIDPYKRPEIFLDLAKEFPKENFLMIISGQLKMALPKNVELLHDIPYNKMNSYYASAKCLVHTSVSEGFGNVFLEAWKNKTPVVSLTVDPDSVLKRRKTGFCSQNFEQMIKDVKTLLSNKKIWKEFSENGYNYVRKEHDIGKNIKLYKQLFLQIR